MEEESYLCGPNGEWESGGGVAVAKKRLLRASFSGTPRVEKSVCLSYLCRKMYVWDDNIEEIF
jgi:hypothetical protein